MLLTDHVLRSNLFPLQHYLQRRGAILEALYQISEGFWFNPAELVMTAFLHLEEKVHRKGLARVEGYSTFDAEVVMPCLRAPWVPGGTTY